MSKRDRRYPLHDGGDLAFRPAQPDLQRRLVQRWARAESEPAARVHTAAERGISGASGPLPHLETIQKAFGKHDVTQVGTRA